MPRIIAVAPQKIPPVPVFGPMPQQPSWSSACSLAERALRQARTAKRPTNIRYAISEAYGEWARTAEIELAGAAGVELQPKRRKRGAHAGRPAHWLYLAAAVPNGSRQKVDAPARPRHPQDGAGKPL